MTGKFVVFGDPELEWSRPVRARLRTDGVRVAATASARYLTDLVGRDPPAVIVLDERLDEIGSRTLIGILRRISPQARIVLLEAPGRNGREEACPDPGVHRSATKPVSESALWEAITLASQSASAERAASRMPLIVCVDDDRLFLSGLARVLRGHGYQVWAYEDPDRALEDLAIVRPDLMILDNLMPGMSGVELLSEVRESFGKPIPTVFLSALDSDRDIARAYGMGAAGYITKPCTPAGLLEVLKRLVADPRPEAEGPRSSDRGPEGWRGPDRS